MKKYSNDKKIRNVAIVRIASWVVIAISAILFVGTVGGLENDTMTIIQFLLMIVLLSTIIGASAIVNKLFKLVEDSNYRKLNKN